jgi:hypothetical protein
LALNNNYSLFPKEVQFYLQHFEDYLTTKKNLTFSLDALHSSIHRNKKKRSFSEITNLMELDES